MNTTPRTIAILVTTAVIGTGAALTASALSQDTGQPTPATTATSTTVPGDVATGLQHAREGERMARDLYAALAKVHDDARPMSMVTHGEDQHFRAVGTLLTRYDVSDPSAGRQAGSYAYPDLQKLYDDWYAMGKASTNAAHQVGVELEKWDIAALQKKVAATSQNDIKQVYTHLLEASQHHLSAYQSAVSGQPVGPGAGNQGRGMGQHMGGQPGQHKGGQPGQHMGNGAHHGMGAGVGQGSGPGAGQAG